MLANLTLLLEAGLPQETPVPEIGKRNGEAETIVSFHNKISLT